MKVSDYIVQFLIDKGITDVFGYPGGSVSNLMDSFRKREEVIKAHVVYHEQAAAFAACSYAQTRGLPGVAYAIGGPGATNLMTGIGHAFCDSIPVVFLTGNVNTYEAKGLRRIRQRGFQEFDNTSVVKPIVKYCAYVDKAEKIKYYLEKAFAIAVEGRPGPVLLDLPMDIQRSEINIDILHGYNETKMTKSNNSSQFIDVVKELLTDCKRPCIIMGNGVKSLNKRELIRSVIERLKIPYVTSMIAFDILEQNIYYQGFIGAYGKRAANFVVAKSDLIIAIGSRMDIRQVGATRENFAPNAKIIRIDIDKGELDYKVHEDEYSFTLDAWDALDQLNKIELESNYDSWVLTCKNIQKKLSDIDDRLPNKYVQIISNLTPKDTIITTDVGQNQIWVAQSFEIKKDQGVLFSGGMGAMGHALPSAIGAYYGSNGKKIICICGDGGLQMNIQELQFIVRENIPIKIVVFNNHSLGMIRHFQEMYFDKVYYQTNSSGGYTTPSFSRIAEAYTIQNKTIDKLDDIKSIDEMFQNEFPALIEINIEEDTYVFPKLEFGKPNQDQEPLIDRELFNEIMDM